MSFIRSIQVISICAILRVESFSTFRSSRLRQRPLLFNTAEEANAQERANPSSDDHIIPCRWKAPEGLCRTSTGEYKPVTGGWKDRVELKDLKVGDRLIGEKISNADLLQAKTGPKIFYECGIGRIDAKGKWQMVSGMLRVAKNYAKPSVVKKKVARLSKKPVELFVHRISLDNGRLEVKLSLEESNDELEKLTPKIPASSLKEGTEIVGKIVQLKPYGCIVDVGANRNGLLHIQKVADLFGKYINREKGLEEAGLERGAKIKVIVKSNEKKKLFLDFTQETKDLAAEEAELKIKEAEKAAAELKQKEAEEAAAAAAAAFGFDVDNDVQDEASSYISEDEAAAWASYADDYEDDYDEDADIEDSLGIGSY